MIMQMYLVNVFALKLFLLGSYKGIHFFFISIDRLK